MNKLIETAERYKLALDKANIKIHETTTLLDSLPAYIQHTYVISGDVIKSISYRGGCLYLTITELDEKECTRLVHREIKDLKGELKIEVVVYHLNDFLKSLNALMEQYIHIMENFE